MAAAIRAGMLCKTCTGNHCRDNEGVEFECPECEGLGCEHCNDGNFSLNGECPRRYCQSIALPVKVYSFADKGFLPVSGGTLDQSAVFVDLVTWFGNEEAIAAKESQAP